MTNDGWSLRRSYGSGGSVAYDVFGVGDPVVLVHGTPSSSYLWRHVAMELSSHHQVYVYDLLGYGLSEQREGQDVSLAAQGQLLAELLSHWGLVAPAVVGHDIGAAIVLRAHLLHKARYGRMALIDAVSIAPWITPFSRHVQRHMTAFATMPGYIHRQGGRRPLA
jgi:pimeloyl-ACP methyl ester carboxylesterase